MSLSVKNTVDSSRGPDPKTSITTERANNQKWDPVLMNHFLEGSKEASELNRTMYQQMERDPILRANPHYYDLGKEEERELTALRIDRISQYLESDTPAEYNRRASLISVFDPQLNTRIGVNLGLFLGCIRGNGTPEQLKFWSASKETKILKHIYGCFAMTELAHGSNVAGLETTATFDKENDQFIINTPHIGATKWWIGGAAHSATHTACYARLLVDGKDYGVKTFIVPLRDSNHKLMPGITVGDIGAKMGRDGIDNGWIQFSNVKVPRFFMLQKFCKVSREGDVVLPPLEQLSYSALLGGRVTMVLDSYRVGARFSTIALRYAIGRRQFKSGKNELETQLLDYPLHQRRLLPFLALTYLVSCGAMKLEKTYDSVLDGLDEAVEKNDMKVISKSIKEMKSLFIDSASLKSTCTWLAADLIDQSRQACGGHGYSGYNGFGKAYNDWVVQCTWEGDNNVLAMSVGKPLIRSIDEILNKDKKASGSISFLNNAKQYLNEDNVLKSFEDVNDLKKVLLSIEILIIRLCKDSLDTIKQNGGQYEIVSGSMVTISKLKAHHYLLNEFLIRTEAADASLKPFLTLIARLYSASIVLDKFSGDFLTYSVVSPKFMGKINQEYIPKLCLEVRPLVINYTDSFQQPDMALNAPIGNFNGDIYENYFGVVKQENNPFNYKAPYSAALESMLNRPSLSDRQRGERSDSVKDILSK
ncbi:fatty-acyl coenzyme A oxidase [Yamadazyma tenuis]|uniref:Acyl-coenzyme A oxidase n=1 Tax=Candida tenuis (strain ATCC 10573 / BCRC 21748 / CBS 615 / JCM 9827 / NBRC 10315 / NRRL Y-1498 / VKM Y-70) TaxID=590646 RepID=G3B4Z6_CANTC|nr:acyl-CoA oxidase [Yamadazyma tenuis ATCC 10573]EGV64025.1 acyl-CoA oxidase [Yamadazyma tenuis ATCC 10573]WEJ96355.1 fatty-acyl coenzyme A oxidase [Yamadazyma tenuis]